MALCKKAAEGKEEGQVNKEIKRAQNEVRKGIMGALVIAGAPVSHSAFARAA